MDEDQSRTAAEAALADWTTFYRKELTAEAVTCLMSACRHLWEVAGPPIGQQGHRPDDPLLGLCRQSETLARAVRKVYAEEWGEELTDD